MGNFFCRRRRNVEPSTSKAQEEDNDNMRVIIENEPPSIRTPLTKSPSIRRPNQLSLSAPKQKCLHLETPTGNMVRFMGNTPSGIPMRFVDETPSSTTTPFHPSYWMNNSAIPVMSCSRTPVNVPSNRISNINPKRENTQIPKSSQNKTHDNNYDAIKNYLERILSITNDKSDIIPKDDVVQNNSSGVQNSLRPLSPIIEGNNRSEAREPNDSANNQDKSLTEGVKSNNRKNSTKPSYYSESVYELTSSSITPVFVFHGFHSESHSRMILKQELFDIDLIDFRIQVFERTMGCASSKNRNKEDVTFDIEYPYNASDQLSVVPPSKIKNESKVIHVSLAEAKQMIHERREVLMGKVQLGDSCSGSILSDLNSDSPQDKNNGLDEIGCKRNESDNHEEEYPSLTPPPSLPSSGYPSLTSLGDSDSFTTDSHDRLMNHFMNNQRRELGHVREGKEEESMIPCLIREEEEALRDDSKRHLLQETDQINSRNNNLTTFNRFSYQRTDSEEFPNSIEDYVDHTEVCNMEESLESVTPQELQELKEEVNDVKDLLFQLQSILESIDDHEEGTHDNFIDSKCCEKLNLLHARMIRLSALENTIIH
jgi:hypothetical protein